MQTGDAELSSRAMDRARWVLRDPDTAQRLAEYYDPQGNYVGASFTGLQPNEPDAFSAADLHSVNLMNVTIDARSTRRLLDPSFSSERRDLLRSLSPDLTLAHATDGELETMGKLHDAVKATLAPPGKEKSSSKWVTAAKLCARKRPALFPVRDRVIGDLLGLGDRRMILYEAFRAMMKDEYVSNRLADLPNEIRRIRPSSQVEEQYPLRLLDCALWRYGREGLRPHP